jgi:hypothetical protein
MPGMKIQHKKILHFQKKSLPNIDDSNYSFIFILRYLNIEIGTMLLRTISGILIGEILGYGYYRFIGCSSGTCPLTSNPWSSILYGALIGYLISGA